LGELQEIGFGEDAADKTKERCFPSLAEISAWELIKDQKDEWKREHLCLKIDDAEELKNNIKNPEHEAEEILKILEQENEEAFKPYHKYIAIVQGDGDGFGKYLQQIGGDEDKIKTFSQNIFEFITKARDTIRVYGGYSLVGSGEDLFLFAPVVNGNQNIFTLIDQIDEDFNAIFDDPNLSMSYGISISYYKFPLQESIDISKDALWEQAKKAIWLDKTKNIKKEKDALHINIQKHSGQSHSITLPKHTSLYDNFIKLLNAELDSDDKLHLPHSLHHSLDRVSHIVDALPPENIEHFFTNMFNENIHTTKHKKALKAVQEILNILKQSDEAIYLKDSEQDKPSKVLFAMLSTIKMLRGDR
jgi:CRISPR-associated protein Cmr2